MSHSIDKSRVADLIRWVNRSICGCQTRVFPHEPRRVDEQDLNNHDPRDPLIVPVECEY